MTDIALVPQGVHALDLMESPIDLSVDRDDLATDEGLETAVIISLFTDARAEPHEIPEGQSNPRGWWGDVLDPADTTGSKLWTLQREKSLNAVAVRAEEYARQALQWLIDDGVVSSISAEAEIVDRETLGINVRIDRADHADLDLRFNFNWTSQIAELV